jgi:hypothetical protein
VFNGAVPIRRPALLLALLFVAALINLPLVHHTWTSWRIEQAGVRTTADVVRVEEVPPEAARQHYFVTFRMPRGADAERREYVAEVDRSTYVRAQSEGVVEVDYLRGSPNANRVEGTVTRRIGLWMTLMGDVALAVMLGLMLRFGRAPAGLTLLAGADLVRCPPGGALELVARDEYVARGDVVGLPEGGVVIDVGGGREVRVVLGGFRNPAGFQQPVEVRGRVIPPDVAGT